MPYRLRAALATVLITAATASEADTSSTVPAIAGEQGTATSEPAAAGGDTVAPRDANAVGAGPVPPRNHVVVTATRIPTPLEEVLAPVIVIDRAELERSAATDVADVLRFHAGLDLSRNGGPGQTTAIFIRGAESNHTLVLMDGVRIDPGTIGLPALQNIPPSMIERIEVVKGPRSALYGTDAIGGVVNIITRRESRNGWAAEVGYGDYDTRQASLSGGVGGEHVGFDFGASWLDSDGFPTRAVDDTDSGYDNLSLNARLRAKLGRTELALRHWRSSGTSEYSDYVFDPVTGNFVLGALDQDFDDSITAAEAAWPMGSDARGQVTVSRFEDHIEQNQSQDYLRTVRNSVGGQFDWQVTGRHALGAGVLLSHEDAESEFFGEPMRAKTDVINLYVQDTFASGPHRALIALGYTDDEAAGSAVTGNLEYGYTFQRGMQLYGLAGSGFRAPDATDLYGFGGNPDLEPEHSRNFEVGVRQRLGSAHALSLAAFRNDIDDLIEFVTLCNGPGDPTEDCDGFFGENRNVDRARIEGIEARWEYEAAPWQVRVEATHQDPRNLTTDEKLLRRASNSATAAVQRSFGPVDLGFDVLVAGDRKDYGFPEPVTLDGYVLANLTARWQLTRSLTLVGRIENLFDEEYELADGFNTPDRGLYVTLRYAPADRATSVAAAAGATPPAARGAYSGSAGRSGR